MKQQGQYTQEEFNRTYQFQSIESTGVFYRSTSYLKCNVIRNVISLFPVLSWLPSYKCRTNIVWDLQSGFTVAILHIPQGMGYAALGGVNPIVGLYMAIFPVLVYFLMGTSRHISLGSFSIICLMARKPVSMYSNTSDNNQTTSPIEVATVLCLVVGVVQVLLGFCRVGSLSMFLSESLISGFTTGAAVLVFVSQLEHVLGVKIKHHFGIFNAVYTVFDIFCVITTTNYLSLAISLSVILVLILYTDYIRPRMRYKFMIPIELAVMVIGTLVSYVFDFKNQYSINIVGAVPTGLPLPSVPNVQLIPDVLIDSLLIAVVSFSIQVSMASLFALKDNYRIDPKQELVASGFANIFGGFFSCLPIGVSLSRSVILYSTGGKSQIASVFSSLLLLTVVLYFGKFLEPLPYSVLAGIVIQSLRRIIMQAKDLRKIWKCSVYDGVVWLITFLSVILLSVELGLAIALTLSLLSIVLLNQNVYVCLLGKVPNTDLYLEMRRYPVAQPVNNFIIVQIQAGLHFANIRLAINKIEKLVKECSTEDGSYTDITLIMNMSPVTFADPEALHVLKIWILDFRKSFNIVLVGLTGRVFQQMRKCDFFTNLSEKEIFPSIEDAVTFYSSEHASSPSVAI